MAFRQPAYHAPPRAYTSQEESSFNQLTPQTNQGIDDSQEWILFSPVPTSTTDRTHTTSTERTRQTVGRSRVSDYGSLDTAARSYEYDEDDSEHTAAIVEDEDDGELDSLDSHLQEFRPDSVYRDLPNQHLDTSANPVLPTHDGLGSFRLDRTAMGDGVQEQLYAFERYNPRRIKRRTESLELGQLELENEDVGDNERTRRIEEWRLEQSQALLDEIQKETRRRRWPSSSAKPTPIPDYHEEEIATLGDASETGTHIPDPNVEIENGESFWARITRRVIQDLMGIDDRLLCIIFGEALPGDFESNADERRPYADEAAAPTKDAKDDTWEYRLLDRIARELGLLVNQLSDHPGAFSTYLDVQQTPLPYAGLPIIPEAVVDMTEEPPQTPVESTSMPVFRPTIPTPENPVDIAAPSTRPVEDDDTTFGSKQPTRKYQESDDSQIGFSKEEWEKQLDIGLVFSYLRSRFTSRKAPAPAVGLSHSALRAPTSPQDAAARAARVRELHPLVARPKTAERRASYKVIIPATPIQHRRRGSSCASQSTKKSARRTSGSSRHYWDINGSIGSGSLIVSTGAMGSWGEV